MAVEATWRASAGPRARQAGVKTRRRSAASWPNRTIGILYVRKPVRRALHALFGHISDGATALRYTTGGHNAAYYWVDQNLAYVLSGPMETGKLREIAQAAYDQIDRRTAPPG